MKHTMAVLLALLFFTGTTLHAQCSDAGACSIGGAMHEQDTETPEHALTLRYGFGSSGKSDDLQFHSLQIEAELQLLPNSRLSVRLPWTNADGPLGSANGFGDLLLVLNQLLWRTDDIALHLQGGAKIATGEDNAEGLPQAYQPGLGTNDLLFGVNLMHDRWHFAAVYQYSGGRSANSLTRLRRGDDLMMRAGYAADISDLNIGMELLAVKRLALSSVLDATTGDADVFMDIPGSDQFQLNLAAQASLPVTDALTVLAHAAIPLLKREVNVDGLTRALTLSAGMRVHF